MKSKFENSNKISMKGPLGLGLGIKHDTIYDHLIMVENEGILPFVDFLEMFC